MTPRRILFIAVSLVIPLVAWPQESLLSESDRMETSTLTPPGLTQKDDVEQALSEAREALEVAAKQLPATDPKIATYALNYGEMLLHFGYAEESVHILTEALSRAENLFGKRSEDITPLLLALANSCTVIGDLGEQRKYLRRAATIVRKTHGKKSLAYADIALTVGAAIVGSNTLIRRPNDPVIGRYGFIVEGTLDPAFTRAPPDSSTSGYGKAYLRTARKIFILELGTDSAKAKLAAYYLGRIAMDEHRHDDAAELMLPTLNAMSNSSDGGIDQYKALLKDLECLGFLEVLENSSDIHDRMSALENEVPQEAMPAAPDVSYDSIKKHPPAYPSHAIANSQIGYVDVIYTIDKRGAPTNIRIIYSCNRGLFDAAAIQATRMFEFSVPMIDGIPVTVPNVKTRVAFRMYK